MAAPQTALLNVTPTEFNRVQNDLEEWKQVTSAINVLKAVMLAHPALVLPSTKGGRYLVSTDASDFATAATLRQMQMLEDGKWPNRIIAHFSYKVHDSETRYAMYHKELLGVKDPIEH
jgi:hypothetical protein